MQLRSYLQIAVIAIAAILCVATVQAWRADQRDRAQLASELAATKQLLTAADARQHDRDTQLSQTLAALTAEKRSTITPQELVSGLQKNLALPLPIALQDVPPTGKLTDPANSPLASANNSSSPQIPTQAPAQAVIPSQDLKPLYDFTLDCQACQAKLATAQSDLTDERTKTAALTKERDDALRVAKGGSAWHRIGRAAKWFLLGAAAGAALSRAQGH